MRQADAQKNFDIINTKLNIIIEHLGVKDKVRKRLQEIMINEEEAKSERSLSSSPADPQHHSQEDSAGVTRLEKPLEDQRDEVQQ